MRGQSGRALAGTDLCNDVFRQLFKIEFFFHNVSAKLMLLTCLTQFRARSPGFRTDTQIVTKQKMRSIIAQTKKREKDDENDVR